MDIQIKKRLVAVLRAVTYILCVIVGNVDFGPLRRYEQPLDPSTTERKKSRILVRPLLAW